ncbi:MAG: hypothetical protein AABY15_05285 [Nanoarchaeota archaeon]
MFSFCGSIVEVKFDVNEEEGKFCFRKLENGEYKKGEIPISRHSNILKGVIIGKKGWGLWVDQWSDGIVDWTFTKEEILNEFKIRNIKIPESLLKDFENRIEKKRRVRNEKYLESLLEKEREKKRIEDEEKEKNENIRRNSEFLGSGGMWV